MKKKLLSNSKFLFSFYLIYMGLKYKYFTKKKSYSQFEEDLVIKEIFGNFVGKYVDIGCFHPVKYNNTALLHKNGWTGTNIDLNQLKINCVEVCSIFHEPAFPCPTCKTTVTLET